MKTITNRLLLIFVLVTSFSALAADKKSDPRADYIRANYTKYEYQIPMRDDVKLFTSVYVPNDDSKTYPMMFQRTPYRVAPYGADKYKTRLGPSDAFEKEGFIFVFQDVRGKFMSEGEFVNMRPQDAYKRGNSATDDATDTYDSIEWLVKNVDNNNGNVGMWGTSYPGYYTSVGAINSHPALKAISPQAPIADWFFDDFHRNGAFVTPMAFIFFDTFDKQRDGQFAYWPKGMDQVTPDGYQFFKDLGPLTNVNEDYFNGERPFWNEIIAHPNYDDYWQSRDLLQHLSKTKPATLVVGGWYDTEDLYGPLYTYQTMSQKNSQSHIKLVMGPWSHGQWNSTKGGASLGEANFGFDTSAWFQKEVLLPFFKQHLKGEGEANLATATMFETGSNRWKKFDTWPPKAGNVQTLYLGNNEQLLDENTSKGASEYISDPNKPVPHSAKVSRGWDKPYMVEDQRFAARRPDVLVFETDVLENDMTIAGAIDLDLWFSTTQTAADIVVKVVDVFPGKDDNTNKVDKETGNRHELVRWSVIRGRFRESMSEPKPFVANQPTKVTFDLYDILHTFKRGHKLQIQIQSSMFPFIDINPQHYVDNIFEAKESDYVKAMHTIYHNKDYPSAIRFKTLDN
ncbi:X-Pro dipeptidyl-peptidase [Alteromonas australica]|uniref:CocE/NonD family hydrolase n=1 Tax=Alteromonas TaxID=226 RepID=UPI0005C3D95D|nr:MULTISPECIES: CocE/NonD family hydrolase [Alteromonas]AJP44979.1 X-Pro dipeptidyl-peptidase [Alteromonas australica]QPL50739.1 CocE/NonD family hydrolase [Alteromonas sp. B31-7]|tara:strand:- start:2636 stop:4510 length:1875 start_codon:yes stop_codon:yes gene_type:complete